MGGSQWMVVLIVAIVVIARLVRTGMAHEERKLAHAADPEAGRLRDEVRALKDRIAVLERIATDDSAGLDRQIEALRDRRTEVPRDRRDHATSREG